MSSLQWMGTLLTSTFLMARGWRGMKRSGMGWSGMEWNGLTWSEIMWCLKVHTGLERNGVEWPISGDRVYLRQVCPWWNGTYFIMGCDSSNKKMIGGRGIDVMNTS